MKNSSLLLIIGFSFIMSCLLMCDLHASGYDALINFHTRPTYRGSEFNIGGNTWIRPDGVNGRGRDFNKTSPWADFTYTEDKWNVQADASWQWEQSGMSTYTTRTFPLNNYEERMLEQDLRDSTDLMRRRSLALETAVDYRINDRHIVSALVGVSTTGFQQQLGDKQHNLRIAAVLSVKQAVADRQCRSVCVPQQRGRHPHDEHKAATSGQRILASEQKVCDTAGV